MKRTLASQPRTLIAVSVLAAVAFAGGLGARYLAQQRIDRLKAGRAAAQPPAPAAQASPASPPLESALVMEAGHGALPQLTRFAQAMALARRYAEDLDPASTADHRLPASALAELGRAMRQLSVHDTVAVPGPQRRRVMLLGEDLIKAATDLHNAGSGPGTAEPIARIRAAIDNLAAALPEQWICAMHCEGPGVTHGQPGRCPICQMSLSRVDDLPYTASIAPANSAPIQPGVPTPLRIQLIDPIGRPVTRLATVHEAPLHLLSVSGDLSWYSHDHPIRQNDGSFTVDLTFPHPGEFTLFTDFTPEGLGQQVPRVLITVPGTPPPPIPLIDTTEDVLKLDGYEFLIRCNGGKFIAGRDAIVRFGISFPETATEGPRPVTDLEPYLGAMGHLVIISQDLSEFVHSHPVSSDDGHGVHTHPSPAAASSGDPSHPAPMSDAQIIEKARALNNGSESDVIFHTMFPRATTYKAFAQFKHRGRVLTAPFVIAVEPPPAGEASPSPDPAHRNH